MSCAHCGCDLAGGGQFCVRCGKQTAHAEPQGWAPVMSHAATMPMPFTFQRSNENRLAQHLPALAIAWSVFGAWRLFALTFFTRHAGDFTSAGHHVHIFWPVIGFSSFFFSALALIAGLGLLTRRGWARKLAIVLGVLCLLKLPFGTALGVYTLWVLGSRRARDQWRQMQAPRDLW